MSIYLVALTEPSDAAWENLEKKDKWKHHYVLTDRLALVATEHDVLTEDVCESVGMNDEEKVTGFVAEIDHTAINGWTKSGFWEYLRKNQ